MSYTLTDLAKEIILQSHPVGSYLFTSNSADPSTYMGGVWEQVKGRFLYALEDGQSVGETGGEKSHTLTTAETPSHTHTRGSMEIYGDLIFRPTTASLNLVATNSATNAFGYTPDGGTNWGNAVVCEGTSGIPTDFVDFKASRNWTGETSSVGGNQAHNNMPPYLAVYVFKRIS
jgi:microcystin-dependent protein